MSDNVFKRLKIVTKEENKMILILKDIQKSETLKNIREQNSKITPDLIFYDGDELVDLSIEDQIEIGDIVDNDKVYVNLKVNSGNNNSNDEVKSKEILSDGEKALIKVLYEKDSTLSEIYTMLQAAENTKKGNEIKKYYESIQRPLKPIPNNLEKLYLKINEIVYLAFNILLRKLLEKDILLY